MVSWDFNSPCHQNLVVLIVPPPQMLPALGFWGTTATWSTPSPWGSCALSQPLTLASPGDRPWASSLWFAVSSSPVRKPEFESVVPTSSFHTGIVHADAPSTLSLVGLARFLKLARSNPKLLYLHHFILLPTHPSSFRKLPPKLTPLPRQKP